MSKNERNRPKSRSDGLYVFGKYPPTYKMKIAEFYPFKPKGTAKSVSSN